MQDHPDLQLMGGEQDVLPHLMVTFVLRTDDNRVLALFFGPDAHEPTTWVLVNWLPVPMP